MKPKFILKHGGVFASEMYGVKGCIPVACRKERDSAHMLSIAIKEDNIVGLIPSRSGKSAILFTQKCSHEKKYIACVMRECKKRQSDAEQQSDAIKDTQVDKTKELSLDIQRKQGSFDHLLNLHDLTLICILHTVLTAAVVTQTL